MASHDDQDCVENYEYYCNDAGDNDNYDDDDEEGDDDLYIIGAVCLSVTFLLIFVSRNGRKRVLPFLDTFGSRSKRKCA